MSKVDQRKPWCLTHDRPRYYVRSRRCWVRMNGHRLRCRWIDLTYAEVEDWRRAINPPHHHTSNGATL